VPDLELHDIQGLVSRGYPDLKAATYVLLQVDDPADARSWLGDLADRVSPAPANPPDVALNVALSPSGLQKLGLPSDVLNQFSDEFTAGMTTDHRRRMFGDIGTSAPENWRWGGPATPVADVLLLLFGTDAATIDANFPPLRGVSEVIRLETTTDLDGKEHFGFADGISQPTIDGLSSRKDVPPNTIQAGEFILGYVNEYGLYTDRPMVDSAADPRGLLPPDVEGSGRRDLGRNGSYLVFRQLAQDVRGFWQYVDSVTRQPDGSDDAQRRTWLAAKMVGRWPSGAPVTLSPDADNPLLAQANDFTYQYADQNGFNCPIGAHIRRTHPRDSLDPAPGTAASVNLDKRHRLLRRGREYGPPLPPNERLSPLPQDDPERGIYFICVVGNIGRQFELIQHSWLNNPHFNSLYDESDPVVAYHAPGADSFTVPAEPIRERFTRLPTFVATRGGGYFFLPGIGALHYLASL
jgi:Dyp-type peroxidase family